MNGTPDLCADWWGPVFMYAGDEGLDKELRCSTARPTLPLLCSFITIPRDGFSRTVRHISPTCICCLHRGREDVCCASCWTPHGCLHQSHSALLKNAVFCKIRAYIPLMKLGCLDPRPFTRPWAQPCWGASYTRWRLAGMQDWRNLIFCGEYLASTGNNEDCQFSSHLLAFYSYSAHLQRRFRHPRGLRIHPETERFSGGGSAAGPSVVLNKVREWEEKGRECRWVTNNNRVDQNIDISLRFRQTEARWMNDNLRALWVWTETDRQTRCVLAC